MVASVIFLLVIGASALFANDKGSLLFVPGKVRVTFDSAATPADIDSFLKVFNVTLDQRSDLQTKVLIVNAQDGAEYRSAILFLNYPKVRSADVIVPSGPAEWVSGDISLDATALQQKAQRDALGQSLKQKNSTQGAQYPGATTVDASPVSSIDVYVGLVVDHFKSLGASVIDRDALGNAVQLTIKKLRGKIYSGHQYQEQISIFLFLQDTITIHSLKILVEGKYAPSDAIDDVDWDSCSDIPTVYLDKEMNVLEGVVHNVGR
jgi:hypothetical protein